LEHTLALEGTGAGSGTLELRLATLRRRFADAQRPRPAIFWSDLCVSATIGWAAFAVAGTAPVRSLLSFVALGVAVLALYRAVLFIHEIAHLKRGAMPGFEVIWNLAVGLPLMAPSLMYVGSHHDHHNVSLYGTEQDPEYERIVLWSPLRILASFVAMVVLPPAIALRWGVIGPVSRLIPPLRPFVVGYLSTLVINPFYRRAMPVRGDARRWALEEFGGFVYFWAGAVGLYTGVIPLHWLGLWYAAQASILILNHARTLVAHRYEGDGRRLDWTEQLVDSVNIVAGSHLLTMLAAPVGLRYHGLHHMMPGLPYHNLGAVHRTLLAELPEDSPYRDTVTSGVFVTLGQLLRRSRKHAS
jgi:fatty acid desaturase